MTLTDRVFAEIRASYALGGCAEADPSDEEKLRRVTAFWSRLGDPKPREAALDSLARALALGVSEVEQCQEDSRDRDCRRLAVTDALLFAAR
jgi:hypothetical protein